MILTLEVIGEQAEDLGAGSRKIFEAIGGTIGRLPDNDWVFPDPYVSGRHALIRYVNGKFFVEDTSTNGVFINSPDNRIPRAEAHQLSDGDLLFIDAYRIQVSIEKPAHAGKKHDDPFELLKAHARNERSDKTVAMAPRSQEDRTESMVRTKGEESSVDWIAIDSVDEVDSPKTQLLSQPAATPAKRVASPPPPPPPSPPRPAPSAAREPVAAAAPPKRTSTGASDELIRELMSAAGIEGVEPTHELAQTLGRVLRAGMSGVMDVLRARERVKDDMRLRGTTFKPQHNNPLKFSANVDDAFHNMLVKHNPAYLAPADALEDALRDIANHQAAIVAATRMAFEAMLADFDPARLQEEFDRQMKKGSILGVPAKLRYWDLYREKYADIMKDADSSFRTLFGDEMAKAYEEHLDRLQALERNRSK